MLKLSRFLRPFAPSAAGVLVLVFLQTMADLYLPTLMSEIIDEGVMRGDTARILAVGGRMLLVTGGSLLCAVAASWLSSNAAMGFGAALRKAAFARVEGFSLHEFDRFGAATLITRTTNDVTQVQNVTIMIMRMMVMAPIMAVGGIVMAFGEDRPLTLTLAVTVPLLGVIIALLASKAMPLFKAMQSKVDRLNLVLREGLNGMRVIRAFNRTTREETRFDEANEDITATYISVNRLMAFLMPVVMLVMNLTSVSILWFGVRRIDAGAMSMGSLMAFTQYAMQIMFSMLMLSMMFIMVPRAAAAADRIEEVLAVEPSIKDPAGPKTAVPAAAGRGVAEAGGGASAVDAVDAVDAREKARNASSAARDVGLVETAFEKEPGRRACADVEFRDVTFSYHGAERPAIRGVSFHARCGEVTAIVGSTGAGKSTLAKLVPRFYDVDSGSVLVDGVDVREMRQEDLRRRIGYVPQRAFLFSGTIADNIRFGAESASEADLAEAAQIAQAAEFIASFDGGFEHRVAQGGSDVSGGQKQRLSIARALARRPEIFLFDDSFSALDFKTDARLRTALKSRLEGSTVILIAQRIGTVMDADRIIVLEDGRVAGVGRHRDLLETCAVYREIAASQLSEEELA